MKNQTSVEEGTTINGLYMPWELIGYSFLRFSVLKLGIIIGYLFPVWSLGHARELYELKKECV